MSGVRNIVVEDADSGQRLDRWLRNRFPNLKQGKIQKLLRTGQIRLDGARSKAADRVEEGQTVRIPPNIEDQDRDHPEKSSLGGMDIETAGRLGDELKECIIYIDDDILAINKPPGLAVQGGSGTDTHIDGALDRLKLGAKERPRLVHRLDKDTSGVLLLARTRASAARLAKAFKDRETRKIYWAAVVGKPPHEGGMIDAPLAKLPGQRGDLVQVDENMGKSAKTRFRIIDQASKAVTWLELEPLTGRTHQLRVHCQLMGNPIVGDAKYGERDSAVFEAGIARMLHLHARAIMLPRKNKAPIQITAPLPAHMLDTWKTLGFDPEDEQAQLIDL
ncbi:RluA family pseudouridine synthase [Thalassospiraceae bacterium LMO-JJ14]|nr:RluA family pseudouridine synthase [Thalassospiraceae bacterium LMO-JJ14]